MWRGFGWALQSWRKAASLCTVPSRPTSPQLWLGSGPEYRAVCIPRGSQGLPGALPFAVRPGPPGSGTAGSGGAAGLQLPGPRGAAVTSCAVARGHMPRRPLCFERRWQRDRQRRRGPSAPDRRAPLPTRPHPRGQQLPRGAARRGPFPAVSTGPARGRAAGAGLGCRRGRRGGTVAPGELRGAPQGLGCRGGGERRGAGRDR